MGDLTDNLLCWMLLYNCILLHHQVRQNSEWHGVDFTNIFTQSFYARRSQKHKNTVMSSMSFCAFGICPQKAALKTLVKSTPDKMQLLTIHSLFLQFFRKPITWKEGKVNEFISLSLAFNLSFIFSLFFKEIRTWKIFYGISLLPKCFSTNT